MARQKGTGPVQTFVLLSILDKHPEPIKASDVIQGSSNHEGHVYETCVALERIGWVKSDRRGLFKFLTLTESGLKVALTRKGNVGNTAGK